MIDTLPAIYNKTTKKDDGKTEVTPEIGFDLGYNGKVQKNYIILFKIFFQEWRHLCL